MVAVGYRREFRGNCCREWSYRGKEIVNVSGQQVQGGNIEEAVEDNRRWGDELEQPLRQRARATAIIDDMINVPLELILVWELRSPPRIHEIEGEMGSSSGRQSGDSGNTFTNGKDDEASASCNLHVQELRTYMELRTYFNFIRNCTLVRHYKQRHTDMHYDTLSPRIICKITQHPELLFISSNLRTFASIPEGIIVIICN